MLFLLFSFRYYTYFVRFIYISFPYLGLLTSLETKWLGLFKIIFRNKQKSWNWWKNWFVWIWERWVNWEEVGMNFVFVDNCFWGFLMGWVLEKFVQRCNFQMHLFGKKPVELVKFKEISKFCWIKSSSKSAFERFRKFIIHQDKSHKFRSKSRFFSSDFYQKTEKKILNSLLMT